MDQTSIYKFCKNLGCCEACCLRYLGIKNPNAYENSTDFVTKFQEQNDSIEKKEEDPTTTDNNDIVTDSTKIDNENSNRIDSKENINTTEENGHTEDINGGQPAIKKRKLNICVSCLGVLQEENWKDSFEMVKEVLDKKGYESETFACALSSPIAALLRERAITLHLADEFTNYDAKILTPLKEAWKWSFGVKLAGHINKTLDSGAISPLLITVNMDYVDDIQELEILKTVSPKLFEERSKQKRRFATEFTRRSVEQALEHATLAKLRSAGDALKTVSARAACVSVTCAHAPIYLAGRYLKLSRNLPQSPWILDGKRVLPSSVQEIIFGPISKYYKFEAEDADRRLKFIAAGREDVDVRCLGDGRPFAIEISDPTRQLSVEELSEACKLISESGEVIVKTMVPITRDDLTQLKKGEETKSKTYEALCIKLSHSSYDDVEPDSPIKVTQRDIDNINAFTNTQDDGVRISIQQRTPIRVLHRRPLLSRNREILDLKASLVPEHDQLFIISARTSAGTYVKEWAHGELRRSRPALGAALAARVDLLALDVRAVHLDWPPTR